jgi:hypothetical protein
MVKLIITLLMRGQFAIKPVPITGKRKNCVNGVVLCLQHGLGFIWLASIGKNFGG